MPGMRLFGRRCALATDDFLLIGFIDSIVFLPWLGWIPVAYASFLKSRAACEDLGEDGSHISLLLHVALPWLCAQFLLNWLLAASFVIVSARGTIAKPDPRRHVVTLVYIKLIISSLDILWAILGTVLLAQNSFCDIIGVEPAIKVSTIFFWTATLVRLLMIVVFYDWSFSKSTKQRTPKQYFAAPVRKGTFKRWKIRLQTLFLWCTTPSEARKQALKTASELLALLSCDLDLVASDLIAGLLLYRQKCLVKWKVEKEELKEAPPISNADGEPLAQFPPPHLPQWMNLELAKRYMNIGIGVFGWPWVIYRNVACGCCLLLKGLTCCLPLRRHFSKVKGDNLCGCHLSGLLHVSQLPFSDMVHVSFVDRVFEVPFFVCFDHPTSSVIVVTRGTFSMNDVLTDCAAEFEAMDDDPGLPAGALCHTGMLQAARRVKERLQEEEILREAFQEKPDYQLVITGHSLGASVASVLTVLYRLEYPAVRCYAFCPPPAMNAVALPVARDLVFSLLYGNDSVPYLNYENVKNMVVEMVRCIDQCDLPKYKIFLCNEKYFETLWNQEKNSCNGSDVVEKLPANENGKNGFSVEIEVDPSTPCVTERVSVAGTILHIRKIDGEYKLRLAQAEEYRPLSFRPKSIINHFPQYVQKCLNDLGSTPLLQADALPKPAK